MKNLQRRKKEFFKKILKELKNLINLKIEFKYTAGWSSLVARQAHNLKVGGSNPSPATNFMNTNHKKIYSINHYNFFDKLVLKKRLEISKIINNSIKNLDVRDVLDIGTTNDQLNPSSNIIIKSI